MNIAEEAVSSREEYYEHKNTKFRVISLRKGKEHQSPWFYSIERARKALEIIQRKGFKAIIYVD